MKQVKRYGTGWLTILLVLVFVLSGCASQPAQETPPATGSPIESPSASSPTPSENPVPEPSKSIIPTESPETSPAIPSPASPGSIDSGFRPEVDGFSFENYGKDPGFTNLAVEDLVRLFGESIVASREGGKLILSPPAQKWLEEVNAAMGGGHCEGMATLSLLFFLGKSQVSEFGAATTNALQIPGNEKLQREIAYWWATQITEPAAKGVLREISPSEVVDRLIQAFQGGRQPAESYTIGFYKPDRSGGHAVTPYAIQDKGDGKVGILIYDNNYPNASREIVVDRAANTWSYSGSTNPAEQANTYTGDATTKTLEIVPTSVRLEKQVVPFLASSAGTGQAQSWWESALGIHSALAAEPSYNEIWVDGAADFLITDDQGRRLGVSDGRFLREIPGGEATSIKLGVDVWAADQEPIYYLPTNVTFTMSLDGKNLKQVSAGEVTMIGPGYDLEISDIQIEPGQKDSLVFSPDGTRLSYQTTSSESPDIMLGMEGKEADYAFLIKGFDLQGGGTLEVARDMEKGRLSMKATGASGPGAYGFLLDRISEQGGEQIFGHEGIILAPGDTAYFYFAQWTGEGGSLKLEIDRNSDGTIDEVQDVSDLTNELSGESLPPTGEDLPPPPPPES